MRIIRLDIDGEEVLIEWELQVYQFGIPSNGRIRLETSRHEYGKGTISYKLHSWDKPLLYIAEELFKQKAREKGIIKSEDLKEIFRKIKEATQKYEKAKELQKEIEKKAWELEKAGIVESTAYGVVRLIDGRSEIIDVTADLDETLERLQRVIDMLENIDLFELYRGAYERYKRKVEELEEEICKFAGDIREFAYILANSESIEKMKIVEKLEDIAEEYCPEHWWI